MKKSSFHDFYSGVGLFVELTTFDRKPFEVVFEKFLNIQVEILFRIFQHKKTCLFQLRKCFIQCHSESSLSSVMVSNMNYFDGE